MCGILGFIGNNTPANIDLIRELMLILSLRGTHATGMASVSGSGHLSSVSLKCGADAFFEVTRFSPPGNTIRLVGHTRYSTSDLNWNQPICDGQTAVVMNGVISQEPPAKWPRPCAIVYTTGNDAEIALEYANHGKRGRMPGSWAICELDFEGHVLCYRNAYRPLWAASADSFQLVCSTSDALLRCGLTPLPFAPSEVVDLESGHTIDHFPVTKDLQPGLNGLWPALQCHV